MSEELTVQQPGPHVLAINPGAMLVHMKSVQEMIKTSLTHDEDYMRLPGTNKDTLLQPGAEKLAFAAQLTPAPAVEEIDLGGGHREYKVSGDLVSPDGRPMGSGHASCSTMESKYRYRYVTAPCPDCGQTGSIMKSQYPPKGAAKGTPPGWYCNPKKDGCGTSLPLEAGEFKTSREENTDLADVWNTVLQMAVKRWLVSTVKRTLAVSGMFTMDLEDMAPPIESQKPATTSASARRQRNKPPKGGGGNGGAPEGPPLDAYDDAPPTRGGSTISPNRAAEMNAWAGDLDLDIELEAKACGWDGPLLQMPLDHARRLRKRLMTARKEAGKS